jgi:hypothetical protein
MRSLNILPCLSCGGPDEVLARNFDSAQERLKRYQALLTELAAMEVGCKTRTVIDLPEDLREAIDIWTCGCRS